MASTSTSAARPPVAAGRRRPRTGGPGYRWPRAAQIALDVAAWAGGLVGAAWARYEFDMTPTQVGAALLGALVAVAVHVPVGHLLYLYRGRYAFGSFEEVRGISATVAASAAVLLVADLVLPSRPLPASTPLVGAVLALVAMLALRYVRRLQAERAAARSGHDTGTPVLLFGAGAAGRALLRSMRRDPHGTYRPVGLLDDDPRKRHLRIDRVLVLGDRSAIAAAATATGAQMLVFSVADADATALREVGELAAEADLTFKVLPSVSELLDRRPGVGDVRDIDVADLLGRHQIETDVSSIAGYLTGRRVLVTGAGGSIGAELCRQLSRYGPSELMMLDRDESALHTVQLSISGRALLDDASAILADLRDADRIEAVFAERRPEVVFHAAALKHQPLLERYPAEALQTNVWGTLTVLEAARRSGVERFVNISTDKAADPCNVLGYAKRVTERLTAQTAQDTGAAYLSVRFGNVLGSRGSVLTAFAAQAASGGPITVTHPDVTRYFMTVPEAVQLVIQAAALGGGGEALVLDMGRPVRIADVARQMAAQAPSPVEIVYTGLRPGEKLHEDLFGWGEVDARPLHPLISHVPVPPLSGRAARELDASAPPATVIAALAELCTRGFRTTSRSEGPPEPRSRGGSTAECVTRTGSPTAVEAARGAVRTTAR